ncbi:MAG TPA: RDD family protein [Methylomirabilota bacterium]|jgi:uncharacterized RDD family membrane protein YckC|nr:RDD family protein [Methylomirabilota bacterium]
MGAGGLLDVGETPPPSARERPPDAATTGPVGLRSRTEAAGPRPAGFWRRTFALAADVVVVWGLLVVGDFLAVPLARWPLLERAFEAAYILVVPAAYFILMHGTGGRTLGKMLAGVRVVAESGEAIGYPRALARQAAWVLSTILFLVGHLAVAVRRDKRALHDLVAGTRVIRGPREQTLAPSRTDDAAMMRAP